MRKIRNLILVLGSLCFVFGMGCNEHSDANGREKDSLWNEISSYFRAPDEFAEDFGNYRSPFVFYNNKDTVKSVNDWKARKREIKDQWNKMMGEWPPFLKNQQLKIGDSSHRSHFTQYEVSFDWLPDQPTRGYLLIPDSAETSKLPAVITVFYEPETAVGLTEKENRDFAYQLTEKGFVTLSLGTTKTTDEKVYSLYYPNRAHAQIQPLSTLAYAAANAWYALAKVPQVDSSKIGIMGHSYGGKWAMFASCLFDKFAAAVWSDPGIVFDETKGSLVNYWEPWYLGYYPPPWDNLWRKEGMTGKAKGLYPDLVKEGYDLHELHALMAPRPFLVSGGESDQLDRWKVLNYTVAVNELLGYKNRVGMTNRLHHAPTEKSNTVAYQFFEYFLKQ